MGEGRAINSEFGDVSEFNTLVLVLFPDAGIRERGQFLNNGFRYP